MLCFRKSIPQPLQLRRPAGSANVVQQEHVKVLRPEFAPLPVNRGLRVIGFTPLELRHKPVGVTGKTLQGNAEHPLHFGVIVGCFEKADTVVVSVAHEAGELCLSELALNAAAERSRAERQPGHLHAAVSKRNPVGSGTLRLGTRKNGTADCGAKRSLNQLAAGKHSHGQKISQTAYDRTMSLVALFLLATTVGGDYAAQFQRWLTFLAEQHWEKRDRDLAAIETRAAIQQRQEQVRRTAEELIGGLPGEKTPLRAIVTGSFTRDGYRVENIIFESLPGFRVTANLYIPTTGQPPYPAVLGVAGHSVNGKASATYQTAFIGFAKRGIAVLAYDPPGQGERLEFFDPASGKSRTGVGVAEHLMAGVQCVLTGTNLARYEIHDGIRAVDYLLTRKEIDPKRIAVAGNSGGGTQAAYLAVLEPRLAAVVSSCYMTRWRELWSGPGPQDAEQVWPGFISQGLDFGDFALALAPRPYLMTTAIRDFFPIDGARATFRQTQRLFDLTGGGEKLGYFEFDDTHGWSRPRREAANRWLEKWFFGRDSDGKEGAVATEEESTLYATKTGQLATSGGSATVQSINQDLAAELASRRRPVTMETVKQAIGWREPAAAVPATARGTKQESGYNIEKLELTTEGGVRISAALYVPLQPRAERAWVAVSGTGKSDAADWRELASSGHTVLALDPRGIGESWPRSTGGGYRISYQTSARAWLLGRNLVEMQAADMAAGLRYLQSHGGGGRIGLYARGNVGPAAIMAAAVTPGFSELVLERSIVSYGDMVASHLHEDLYNAVVPGILKHLDLPDVLALIAPRRVLVLSPVTPNGTMLLPGVVRSRLKGVDVIARGEGWSLRRTAPSIF